MEKNVCLTVHAEQSARSKASLAQPGPCKPVHPSSSHVLIDARTRAERQLRKVADPTSRRRRFEVSS
ncbi:hypothetical protein TKK_0016149 [Trichogramma kaykai]